MLWTSSYADLVEQFLPIRIPIFKGLLGYRLLIINKNDQSKFDQVQSLADLKKLTLGQGRTWGDTHILESAGFKVVKVTKYQSLFYMVDGGRFDAFPRGVHEPYGEIAKHPELNLTVEKHLMLSYKMPMYLFVSRESKELAKNIETGLNRAIADGSFDEVFYGDPMVKSALEMADMKNRRTFYIDNPLLSKETPIDRKELWFDPKTLP